MPKDLYCMIWIAIITGLLLLIGWLLLSPFELRVDTRIPLLSVSWITIAKVTLVYEKEEWWLNIRLLFFRKRWSLLKIIFRRDKIGKKVQGKERISRSREPLKLLPLLTTFRVTQWELFLDCGDPEKNARLYPLNFFPFSRDHIHINFSGENYLLLTIRNAPWRILFAWIK
jgi:hypothetical protein